MENLIKQFCKINKLKFEDFNKSSSILVTSKIVKVNRLKESLASRKEIQKYKYFEYYFVADYGTYIDCITIDSEKLDINYIGTVLTSQTINRLKEKIKMI